MATLSSYKGSVSIVSGLKGTSTGYPLMEAHDVLVKDGDVRLDTEITNLENRIGMTDTVNGSVSKRVKTLEDAVGDNSSGTSLAGRVTSLESGLGTSSATASASGTSAWSRLKNAENDIDTLQAAVGASGNTASATGTTAWSRIKNAESDIDNLENYLGTPSDTSASTGNKAWPRLKNAETDIDNLQAATGTSSTAASSSSTVAWARIKNAETDIDNLQAATGTSSTAASASSTVAWARIKNAESDIDALENAVGESDDSSTENTAFGRIAKLESDVGVGSSSSGTSLVTRVGALENATGTSSATASATGTTAWSRIKNAENDIDTLESAVGTSSASESATGTTAWSRIKSNQTRITTLETDMTAAKAALGTSESTASASGTSAWSRIKNAENDIDTLQSSLSTLTTTNSEAHTKITNTIGSTATLSTDTAISGYTNNKSLDKRMSEAENIINGLQGNMTVVSAKSSMTDATKLYIYKNASPETGMADGHWYYKSGSNWVDGGSVGGLSIDNSLTKSGEAADALATGDAIRELSSDIQDIEKCIDISQNELLDIFFKENNLLNFNSLNSNYNIPDGEDYVDVTSGSLTVRRYFDNRFIVTKTGTDSKFTNLLSSTSGNLNKHNLKVGETYCFTMNNNNIGFGIFMYNGNTLVYNTNNNGLYTIVTIPSDVTRVLFRFEVSEAGEFEAAPAIYHVDKTYLSKFKKDICSNIDAKWCRRISKDEVFYTVGKRYNSSGDLVDYITSSGAQYTAYYINIKEKGVTYTSKSNSDIHFLDKDKKLIAYGSIGGNYHNQAFDIYNLYPNAVYIGWPMSVSYGDDFDPYSELRIANFDFSGYNTSHVSTEKVYFPEVPIDKTTYYSLYSTYDTTDRSNDILKCLASKGHCILAPGKYYISNIDMPSYSTLEGCGANTELYVLNNNIGAAAINMGTHCSVKNLALYGDEEDIELDGVNIEDAQEKDTDNNLWQNGDVEVSESLGYIHIVLNNPLEPGTYVMYFNPSRSENDTHAGHIMFSTSTTTSIGASSIISDTAVNFNSTRMAIFSIPSKAYSVRFISSMNVTSSAGISATFTDIVINSVDTKSGISWAIPSNQYGIIDNCIIAHFITAGIVARDTSTPVDHNLTISNCIMYNNNVGLYIQRDSEFIKTVNCTITRNYYGYLNRGGNNDICNCGIDANKVGILIDEYEGSNTGHGTIANCSINHSDSNTGYGLIVKDSGRMIVTNCNLYYSKIKLENTNGNIISNCGFGTGASIEVINGGCSMIIGCMIRSVADTPITLTNNTSTKVIDCYTRGGVAITPTIV